MKAIYKIIALILLLIRVLISLVDIEPYTILIDYAYYIRPNVYETGLAYFPSFFILSYLLIDIYIYVLFLSICTILSVLVMIKLKDHAIIVIFFLFQLIGRIIPGNIDPFIFLIILIALNYDDNKYIAPILLGFVSFKPSIILVLPYFIYFSKERLKFILVYTSAFILFNIYLLFNIDLLFTILQNGTMYQDFQTYLRVVVIYIYYRFALNLYLIREQSNKIKIQERLAEYSYTVKPLKQIIIEQKKD